MLRIKNLLFLVAALLFTVCLGAISSPKEAKAADIHCTNEYIVNEVFNSFLFSLNCPSMPEGDHFFNFGDGSDFFVHLNAQGDSARFPHDYPYEVGGLSVYTAGVELDGVGGLDYTFTVTIDDRPKETFAISDTKVLTSALGTTWTWPIVISATGEFIVSVDNLSCNGLAETYNGKFRTDVTGPISFDFTNFVKSGFLDGDEDPNSGITIMRDGIVLFYKKISAPMCEAPKPNIQVLSSSPYTRGNSILVNVSMPENANVLEISSDFGFGSESEQLPKGCHFVGDYGHIRCTETGGDFTLDLIKSLNPEQDHFTIRASAIFTSYNVDYGNGHPVSEQEVVLPLQPAFQPKCSLLSDKIDPATYWLGYSWESEAEGSMIDSGGGFPEQVHLPGLSGTGSFTVTYPFSPGAVFTATLFVVGGINCEEVVTLQQEVPDSKCTIDVREGATFNQRQFKVTWTKSYWANPKLNFGDNSDYGFGSSDEILSHGESDWVTHDYSWDIATGRADYTAEFLIPVGMSSVTCAKAITIVKPFMVALFIPALERS